MVKFLFVLFYIVVFIFKVCHIYFIYNFFVGDFMKRNQASNTNVINNDSDPDKNSFLCNFGYVDYIILSSTIAIALGEELSSNDLNVLASFFAVLSDELALISAVEACPQNNNSDDEFVFVPPDVAMTCNKSSKKNTKKRTIIKKKIKKKKIKKRKDT